MVQKVTETHQILNKIAGAIIIILLGIITFYQQKQVFTMEKYIDKTIELDKDYTAKKVEILGIKKDIDVNTEDIKQNTKDIEEMKPMVQHHEEEIRGIKRN